jgi:flagellar basal-body rod protein FlgB
VKSSLDNPFGIHQQALLVRERRAQLLGENLANADTPHYKARDLDFRMVLDGARAQTWPGLKTTHALHIPGGNASVAAEEALYRVPTQPSIDGNTVDPQTERSAFLDNALRYQASLQFLDGRIRTLTSALRGE